MPSIAKHGTSETPLPRLGISNSGRLLLCLATLAVHSSTAALASAADSGGNPAEPPSQPASDKAVCAQAFEQAQRLQRDSKYIAANRELLKCANPTCGDAIFGECSKMYRDIQEAMPTLVFSARDAQTNTDRSDVTVHIDGQVILQRLDGRPVPIDPGSHRFEFTVPGRRPIEQDHVIIAGDKFRQLTITFDTDSTAHRGSEPAQPSEHARPIPTASYVLAGVGLAALGTFGVLRVVAANDYRATDERCAPDCPQTDLDRIKREYLISNIAAGVGGVALASALIVYLATPNDPHGAALRFGPNPGGGMSARLLTHF